MLIKIKQILKSFFSNEPVMPFGKHKGIPISKLSDRYVRWLVYEAGQKHPFYLQVLFENEWERRKQERKKGV